MTPSRISIELAQISDAVPIAETSRHLIESGLIWSWRPARVRARIYDPNVHVIVARDAERIAGFAVMQYGIEEAYLELFGVDVAYQRQGIGRRLIDWFDACLLNAGISTMFLHVRIGNHGAIAFYEKMGFRSLMRCRRFYRETESALRMGRDIGLRSDPPPVIEWRP